MRPIGTLFFSFILPLLRYVNACNVALMHLVLFLESRSTRLHFISVLILHRFFHFTKNSNPDDLSRGTSGSESHTSDRQSQGESDFDMPMGFFSSFYYMLADAFCLHSGNKVSVRVIIICS